MRAIRDIALENRKRQRQVRMGGYTFKDSIGGYFKNFSYTPPKRPFEKQLLDVTKFADGPVVTREVDPHDAEMTLRVRDIIKRMSRHINCASFKTGPILSDEDKFAVLLPTEAAGNKSGYDALTYNGPGFWDLMTRVASECEKVITTEEEANSLKMLFINYSIAYPRTVAICHDGRVKADPKEYPSEMLSFFKEHVGNYLMDAFKRSTMENKISLNITKSPGFPKIWPDGSPLKPSQQCYRSLDFADMQRDKFLMRRDYAKFKFAWLDDGAIDRNLEFLLGNIDYCLTDDGFLAMFERYFVNAASWGLRMNNGDEPLVGHWSEILKNPAAAGKFRPAVYELDAGHMVNATLNTGKWAEAFHALNHTRGAPLKPRYMYPAPNATYAAPFNGLFKRLIGELEESASGFPSMNVKVLARYQRNFEAQGIAGLQVRFLQFDRSNSEQFITDNFEILLGIFPDKLQKVIRFCGMSILPSDGSGRYVGGGLPSGSPATTFLNMCFGLVENVTQILAVCNVPFLSVKWYKYAEEILNHIFSSSDAIDVNGFKVLANLGTDDQIACIWCKDPQQLGEPRVEGRSLGADIVERACVFGLDFSATGVEVAGNLNINKFALQEHIKYGDAMAYKMSMRFTTMRPELREAIARAFFDLGYGDISDFDNGKAGYDLILEEFGYVPDPIYNRYNFSDLIVSHDIIERDPSNNIPAKYTSVWDNLFNQYFGG